MISEAVKEKKNNEVELEYQWFKENNGSDDEKPDFEYYDFENYFFTSVYPYMIIFLQGTAIVCSILFTFTDYRQRSEIGEYFLGT